jgi:hypothetical protein
MFITVFTTAHRLSLSSTRLIQALTLKHHFLRVHFNIILIPVHSCSNCCFPFKLTIKFCTHFCLSMRATFPAHLTILDFITPMIYVEEYKLSLSSHSFLHPRRSLPCSQTPSTHALPSTSDNNTNLNAGCEGYLSTFLDVTYCQVSR